MTDLWQKKVKVKFVKRVTEKRNINTVEMVLVAGKINYSGDVNVFSSSSFPKTPPHKIRIPCLIDSKDNDLMKNIFLSSRLCVFLKPFWVIIPRLICKVGRAWICCDSQPGSLSSKLKYFNLWESLWHNLFCVLLIDVTFQLEF